MRQTQANWENIVTHASNPQNDAEVLQAAHQLVELYLLFLREQGPGHDLFDTRELPASKEALVNAFRVVIATEHRPNVRALLVKAGMTLAQFQENIGDPLTLKPLPATSRRQAASGRIDIARIRKFDRALLRLGEERVRLSHVFQNAARIAEGKPFHHA
jgi:hypothetical protein